ncbi:Ankyrin [Paraburkholderia ribeironis]|uniref:Ankyrin n=1 Tax=Paraburkholderia ribeironis TaxID=1247936 RepID=A0A1N7S9J5_9BURK|nr:ankyrin repeat domain-containing protein [Paraburkholderia ribeironis]SIT43637.1 Ankyrin [Paraburkholderia ribeironis]
MSLVTDTVPHESASRSDTPRADADRQTPACSAVAKWLSAHDFPDTQSRSIHGMTPLMLAALHGEDHIVAALLDEGACVGALDDGGNHALWYACLGGAPAPILRLIGAGLDIDHANGNDITCLMQAAASGRVEVMWLLMSLGASDSLVAPDGRNAFDMAADFGLQLFLTVGQLREAKRGSLRAADRHSAELTQPGTAGSVLPDSAPR